MACNGATTAQWQREDLSSSGSQEEDLGHVLRQLNLSALRHSSQHAGRDTALLSVLQSLRAVAWCAGWRAANCSKGFGNNARCDEVLLATSCEDAERAGQQCGLSLRTIDSLLEAIHSSAWHCANTHFGNKIDAEEDFQTAKKHWLTVTSANEMDDATISGLQSMVWNACWCTVNWRKGSDVARNNMKLEQRHAQSLGLCKRAAWAPHMHHRRCKKEMAWKQAVAKNFLFSNSLVAIADRGGLRHGKVKLQQKVKKCVALLNRKHSSDQ